MAINWKIKLLNKSTSYYGNTAGTAIDDLDKIASVLGVKKDECFNVIQNCRPIKVSIRGGDVVDGVKFWYQVETKDKNLEIEGYQHGNASGGSEATWEFKGDWWLLKVLGSSGYIWGQTLIRRMDFWSYHINEYKTWTDGKGTKGDSDYNIVAPTCFFSRTFNGMLGAFGAYQGELYDGKWDGIFWTNKPDIVKTWYDKLLNEWKVDFSQKFPGGLGDDTLALVKKEFDNALSFSKKYEDLWTYYKENLRSDLNNIPFHPDGLKEVKKVLEQLKTDKKQAETDRDTAQTSLKSWTDTFGTLKPSEVKTEYDKPKETHTAEDLEKHKPEDLKPADYDQIKGDLKTANEKITTLEQDKTNLNNQLTAKDTSISELNNKLTNKDNELTTANNSITTLTSENELLKRREKGQEAINNAWNSAFGESYGDRPTLGSISQLASKLTEKDAEITKLNQQLSQQGNQATQSAQYLNKLLAIYKAEITDETTKFYQSLKLDNNEVNEKYGNRAITYLNLLNKLNGDSEPEQVNNAFRYVALILATEKAQKESDEWISKPVAKQKPFRQSKLNAFNKIKDAWDEMEGVAEPSELNNPLYLPVITQKQDYINKISNIIKLWQI